MAAEQKKCCDGCKTCTQHKRGGSRKILTWQDKLELASKVHVARFLATATCACGKDCFKKMRQLGEAGVKIVSDLREARVAGV